MIEVAGLRKSYDGRTVLEGVDLVVRPGELVALLGPNGAGKTTTVEIVEGFRDADAGMVRVLGEDPRRGGPALRARVGLMLQGGAGLEPRATARDLVRLYCAFHDGGRRADELIEQVGLAPVAGTRVRRLSGGERQRLSLALALAGEPEVLLLDEPTAGMDPEARRDTRALVASLRREGRTILLTTHDLGDVEELADRVAILANGRIVADASPEELRAGVETAIRFRLHATPAPEALAKLALRLSQRDRGVELRPVGREGRDDDAGAATTFEISPGAASADVVADVSAWAAREGLLVTELRAGAASLEDRYLELTGDRDIEAGS
ncbi:MAG TPA: ABC transporter ATP-binding protein [Candidatus Limnocylindria bacterium]|nr:ABC transporter ATP-binding protein [Candidatus Limnocylindria bacterium]